MTVPIDRNNEDLVRFRANTRASFIWIAAIMAAFIAVWWIDGESNTQLIVPALSRNAAPAAVAGLPASDDLPAEPALRELTPQEREWARTAWKYFEDNTDASTGLVGSVQGFGGATMWDTGSYLLALVAANDTGLVAGPEFDGRVSRALESLAKLPLYADVLPNKSYDIRSLAMTDYANKPSKEGIGASALDVARAVVALQAIAWRHPQHAARAHEVLARWDFGKAVRGGQLFGLAPGANGASKPLQEGRGGYEQYGARAFALLGLGVDVAADAVRELQLVDVYGIQVPADKRDPAKFGAQNYVLSEPYVLTGLEFRADRIGREAAWRVYRAQEERFKRTGQLTAVTEDHLDRAPWFVYNSVYNAGHAWAAVTDKGADASALRSVSVKAAFGWHAIFRTPYTEKLVASLSGLADAQRGWMAGQYEKDLGPNKALALNTNAVVLESLAYIAHGPLLRLR